MNLPKYIQSVHAQLCMTLCNPMDCSLPGSSVRGFSRQEYWNGLPSPALGDLPDLVILCPGPLCMSYTPSLPGPLQAGPLTPNNPKPESCQAVAADTQAGSGPGHTPDLDPAGLVPRLRVFPITVCVWLVKQLVGPTGVSDSGDLGRA